MSLLTSYVSAADSLVTQPGNTNGDLLVWNSALNQFTPSNPSLAFTAARPWAASTTYKPGDLLTRSINGSEVAFVVTSNYTSGASFSLTDLTNATKIGQESSTTFPSSTLVPRGFRITNSGSLYESNIDRTTGAVFDTTEQANWIAVTTDSVEYPDWTASTNYRVGDSAVVTIQGSPHVLSRSVAGTSGATFDNTESLNWGYISQKSLINTFVPNSLVKQGTKMSNGGRIWESTLDRTTTSTFNTAEQAFWTPVTVADLVEFPQWAANTSYRVGDSVAIAPGSSALTLRRTVASNSGATFDVTEANSWQLISQKSISGWAASELVVSGQLVFNNGKILQSPIDRVTGANLDPTEYSNWTEVSKSGISSWTPNQHYAPWDTYKITINGADVTLRVFTSYSSGATLGTTDLANTTLVSQEFTTTFPTSTLIPKGFRITNSGNIWESASDRTTGTTFDVTEQLSWNKLTNVTAGSVMIGATSSVNGTQGLVPQPLAGDQDKFLKGDGTWGSSVEFPAWSPNTSYSTGDSIVGFLASTSVYLRAISTHTSGSSLNSLELNNWTYIGQDLVVAWNTGDQVAQGQVITQNGAIWQSNSNRVTGATFDSTEQSNWSKLTSTETVEFPAWAASTSYLAGDSVTQTIQGVPAYLVRTTTGTSGATFDNTESLNWDMLSQRTIGAFTPTSVTKTGVQIFNGGAIWQSNFNRVTNATFSNTEKGFWTKLSTNSSVGSWTANTTTVVDDLFIINIGGTDVIMRVANTYVSGATFGNIDLVNANKLSQEMLVGFPANAFVPRGFQIFQGGVIWELTADRNTSAIFNSAEQAFWTQLTGNSVEFPAWTASTAYLVGDSVRHTVGSTPIYLRRTTAGTSAATFTATEAGQWELIGQQLIPSWSPNVVVPVYFQMQDNQILYQSTSNRTTGAVLNAGEFANWSQTTASVDQPELLVWQANTTYRIGDTVDSGFNGERYRATVAHTSGSTLNSTELGNWEYAGQNLINPTFPSNTLVIAGHLISQLGRIWQSSSTRTTGAIFNTSEQAFWTPLNNVGTTLANGTVTGAPLTWNGSSWVQGSFTSVKNWTANTAYSIGELVVINIDTAYNVILRATTAHTSGSSIDTTQLANWEYVSQNVVATTYPSSWYLPIGFQIRQGNTLYQRGNNSLSETSFNSTEIAKYTIILDATAAVSGASWLRAGNAGTTPGTDRIGTTDNQPFHIVTNNSDSVIVGATGNIDLARSDQITSITKTGTVIGGGNPLNIIGQAGSGTDVSGGNVTLRAGASTGTGNSQIIFAPAISSATSGSTANTTAAAWGIFANASTGGFFEGRNTVLNTIQAQNNSSLTIRTNGTGNLNVQSQGSGALFVGTTGTGSTTIGKTTASTTTTLAGVIKQPNLSALKHVNSANQAIAANTATVVLFQNAVYNVNTDITYSAGTITLPRTGLYQLNLNLSVQSATANTRGVVIVTGNTAVLSNSASKAVRLTTANIATEVTLSEILNVTTAGTITIVLTMVAASQVNIHNTVAATANTVSFQLVEIG